MSDWRNVRWIWYIIFMVLYIFTAVIDQNVSVGEIEYLALVNMFYWSLEVLIRK